VEHLWRIADVRWGQKATSPVARLRSALNPTMEIDHHRLDVCFVPTTDVQRPPLFDRGHPLIWIKSAVVGVIKSGAQAIVRNQQDQWTAGLW
jgi:hypothetical protein